MNLPNETPRSTIDLQLPDCVVDVLERRIASHNWDANRVAAAAILHFIENADSRADMLLRLIEVQSGSVPHTPPEDVLEHHRDEVFGGATEDIALAPPDRPPQCESIAAANEVIAVPESPNLNDASLTLDEIAENLARFNDAGPTSD